MSSRWIVFVAIVFCFTASSATPGEGAAPKEETLLTIYVQPDDPEKRFDLADADVSLFRALPKAAGSNVAPPEGGDDPLIKRLRHVGVNLENLDTAKTVSMVLFDDRAILMGATFRIVALECHAWVPRTHFHTCLWCTGARYTLAD